jgi:hypothetical protein
MLRVFAEKELALTTRLSALDRPEECLELRNAGSHCALAGKCGARPRAEPMHRVLNL